MASLDKIFYYRLGVVFVMFNYRMEVSSTSLLPWLKDHIDEMLSQSLPTGIGLSVCMSVCLCVRLSFCVCTV